MKTQILALVALSALAFSGCSSVSVRSPFTVSERPSAPGSQKEPQKPVRVYPQEGGTVKEQKSSNVYLVRLDVAKRNVLVFCQTPLKENDRVWVTNIADADDDVANFYHAVPQ